MSNYKHGGRGPREYSSWISMRSRCLCPTNQAYSRYGGRGISVCEGWDNFDNFLEDMGSRPPETSLDRIDNDGNYTPENCRWATRKEQQINRRNIKYLTLNGSRKTISQWVEEIGICRSTIENRIGRGWIDERILTQPLQIQNHKRRTV